MVVMLSLGQAGKAQDGRNVSLEDFIQIIQPMVLNLESIQKIICIRFVIQSHLFLMAGISY